MKYAHLADLHIGSWREPKLRDLNSEVFLKAMDICVQEGVDFILFAGDLFNTALPSIDKLDMVAKKLKELKDKDIPMYVIPGSHDFSPSGKTMIDVLESAGLFINVCKGEVVDGRLRLKFTVDRKTGAKITGMLGKKGMLDHTYYEDLDRDYLEHEQGCKIFMFHTALTELKPKHMENMESAPLSLLPKGFDYYAGGHVHHRMEVKTEDYKLVTQPGALFPNNFDELEKYGHGGFYIIEGGNLTWFPVKLKETISLRIDCNGRRPEEIRPESINAADKIVTLRFEGKLIGGRISDIDFKRMLEMDAFAVLKNTSALQGEEFQEIKLQDRSVEEIEEALIKEHLQQVKIMDADKELELTKQLMAELSSERKEGETVRDYEERIKRNIKLLC